MAGTFSIPGLGSGIDWTNYINSIRKAQEGALARTIGRAQAKNAAQTTVFANVKGLMSPLKSAIAGFGYVGDFKSKTVSSSDSTIITGSANLTATNQSATVSVEANATNEVWHLEHTGINDSVSSVGGTFSINVRGVATDITVESGTTLAQLSQKINDQNLGVTASVFSTGGTAPSARLSIQDNNLGKYNANQTAGTNFNITVGSPSGDLTALNPSAGLAVRDGDGVAPGFQPITEGRDSMIYVNGNTTDPIYRDTNTISDVLPGVVLNLHGKAPGVAKSISVSTSINQAAPKIQNLLKKYNDVIVSIKRAIAYDLSLEEQTNPTAGDGTLRSLLSQLQNAFTSIVEPIPGGNAVKSLAELGVIRSKNTESGGGDGQLELDEARLNSVISENFDHLVEFFQGGTLAGSTEKFTGFTKKLSDVMDSILSTTTGSLTGKINSLSEQSKRLNDDLRAKLEKLSVNEGRLKDKFARLEVQLNKLNSQGSALTAAVQSISLNNQAIANRK